MRKWRIILFPPSGNRSAPADFINKLPAQDAAKIRNRLETLMQLEHTEWPAGWTKRHTGDLHQLRVDDYRLLFVFEEQNTLVILHAFRKQKRRTARREVKRALANYQRYLTLKERK